jgi:hypothetical protein
MRKNTPLAAEVIQTLLVENRMDQAIGLSRYAGTQRAVLGLLAAYALAPAVIVFAVAGLDPVGVEEVQRLVSRHLDQCSAIHLALPYLSREREQVTDFPGSLHVSLVDVAHHQLDGKLAAKP